MILSGQLQLLTGSFELTTSATDLVLFAYFTFIFVMLNIPGFFKTYSSLI